MPRTEYDDSILKTLDNLHWGQRKLLMSEIEFLTNNYHLYEPNRKKYLLYVGASPGHHINYLLKMFPDIHYVLYDVVPTGVHKHPNVTFHKMFFIDNMIDQYKNLNLFFISDIRNVEYSKYKKRREAAAIKKRDDILFDDMTKQKQWCEWMMPKAALLKFRPTWETPTTEYFDGDIYFQIWNRNLSIEARMIPKIGTTKVWDNKKYEEIMFHFNTKTRRKKMSGQNIPCLGQYYDSFVETDILTNYVQKFEKIKDHDKLKARVCDLSISMTIMLQKYTKMNIKDKYLKNVPDLSNAKPLEIKKLTFT